MLHSLPLKASEEFLCGGNDGFLSRSVVIVRSFYMVFQIRAERPGTREQLLTGIKVAARRLGTKPQLIIQNAHDRVKLLNQG